MEEEALYIRDGDAFVGTILTQGGWDPGHANGGTVLALLGQCLDEVPTLVPMTISRFTADIVRPVPLGQRLHVVPTVVREGKKIQVVELRLMADDVDLVRATALRLRDEDLTDAAVPDSTSRARPADALVPPEAAMHLRELRRDTDMPGFLRAVDMRRARTVDGSSIGCWLKLDLPVVAGEPTSPSARLAFCFDYANLIGMELHVTDVTLINPDVSAHVLRPPTGEWIAMTGETRFEAGRGRGLSLAHLSDRDGVFAVASTSQLIQRR